MPLTKEQVRERFPLESHLCVNYWSAETPEDRALLEQAISFWATEMESRKWPLALQWFTNYAHLNGHPYVHFSYNGTGLNVITPHNGPPGSNLVIPDTITNYLKRPLEGNVSLFTHTRPYPEITPRSDRPEDEDTAKGAASTLECLWEDPLRMQEKQRQVVASMCITGTAAMETDYGDAGAFHEINVDELVPDESALLGARKSKKTELLPVREVRVNTYDAFNLCVDPAATSEPDTWSWVMTSTYQDRGWVKSAFDRKGPNYFPDVLDQMTPEGTTNTPLYWKRRVMDLLDCPDTRGTSQLGGLRGLHGLQGQNPNEVVFRKIDCKPNELFPKGRTLIMAGGRLVYAGDSLAWLPKNPKRWTTVRVFRYFTDPNSFFGKALLSPMIRPQRRINAIDRIVQDFRKSLFVGALLVPESAKIADGYITQEARQTIRYKGDRAPSLLNNQDIPPNILNERDQLVGYIEMISGLNEVLAGQNPTNVRSALQLDALKRQSLQTKDAIFQAYEETLEQVSTDILTTVFHFYDQDQFQDLMARVAAANRDLSSIAFGNLRQVDLRDNTVVQFDIRSKMMTTPEARKEKAKELLQYGALGPDEKRLAFAAMGFSEFNDSIHNLHVDKARRMISMIRSSPPEIVKQISEMVIEGVDNGMVMAEEFRKEMLRQTWIDMDKDQKEAIWLLFQQYSQLAAKERAEMLMAQAEARQYAMVSQAAGGGPAPEIPLPATTEVSIPRG